jgi:hypothetical protein
MPPARTTIGATTEPSLHDDRNTHITVTELHDTVQVIKELYATVLERNTSGAASGHPQRPLDLDLRTPAGADTAGASSRAPGRQASLEGSQSVLGEAPGRALGERFTELPTEAGLDLDLSSALIPIEASRSDLLRAMSTGASVLDAPPALGAEALAEPGLASEALAEPALASEALAKEAGTPSTAGPGRDAFPDDQLTQSPTEVLIDIDVGTSTVPGAIGRPTSSRVVPLQRPEPDRPRSAAPPFEPIDLQLDLSKPESRNKRREEKSA